MKRLLALCCFFAQARDPFSCANDYHTFVCTSMGSVGNRCIVAQIVLDGVAYTVRQGDRVGEYLVVALSDQGVSLKDAEGNGYFLELLTKKGPSTCVS